MGTDQEDLLSGAHVLFFDTGVSHTDVFISEDQLRLMTGAYIYSLYVLVE